MLDIKFIRDNIELVRKNCQHRLVKCDLEKLLATDKEKRALETAIDELRAEKNKFSKAKPSPEQISRMKNLGGEVKKFEARLKTVLDKYQRLHSQVPNLTHPKVKVSRDENDNPVMVMIKKPTKIKFPAKDHVQLAEALDLIDFERATKVSGAKFYYFKNELVWLELALIHYAFSIVAKHGFVPFITPDLAKQNVLEGLGFNPRGKSTQIYNIAETDLSLIGTAEITMGGYHKDETFAENELPKKYVALSHCFRTEAGSYSKFAKGIFRVHQFTKVEMFYYASPDKSEAAHQELLDIEKEIFKGLALPCRVIDHSTADLGTPAYRTFDLEVWLPGKPNERNESGDWAELTSTSNCTDYQARGLNIKYKNKQGEKKFVHMLNGTAIAIPRTVIAILENYQQADGSVIIPEVLRKYLPDDLKQIKKHG